jgi:Ca2+-binding EF-hand superfamily protein
MQKVDTNGSGKIDFTEFIVAAGKQDQIMCQGALDRAFYYFDKVTQVLFRMEQVFYKLTKLNSYLAESTTRKLKILWRYSTRTMITKFRRTSL